MVLLFLFLKLEMQNKGISKVPERRRENLKTIDVGGMGLHRLQLLFAPPLSILLQRYISTGALYLFFFAILTYVVSPTHET